MSRTIEIGIFALAVLIAALAVHAWLAARDDERRLQSTLAAQKQLIDAATTRETARDATLQQTLAQIDALKRATLTPAEILRELPKYLALPAPIALAPTPAPVAVASDAPAPQAKNKNALPARKKGTASPRNEKPASSIFARLFGSHTSTVGTTAANSLPATARGSGASVPSGSSISDANASASPAPAGAADQIPSSSSPALGTSRGNRASGDEPSPSGESASPFVGGDHRAADSSPSDVSAEKPFTSAPGRFVSRYLPERTSPGSSTTGAAPANRAAPSGMDDATAPRDRSAAPDPSASNSPTGTAAEIPVADLKPLYDYVQDCRACQANLAAAKQNASDDAAKISALARERDAAITAAKGGSTWQRLRRNALWLALGAALGYAARR